MRTRLRSESHCHAQVCLSIDCSTSLKIAQLPRLLLWVLWDTTGWVRTPPAMENGHRPQNHALGLNCFAGRHQTLPAGQIFLLNLYWQQQRTELGMAMYFKQCMHQSHPLSYLWLKEVWFSILEPPIAHFHAWWPKASNVHFNFKWNIMHITKHIALNLYHTHFKRSSMHTHAMQS